MAEFRRGTAVMLQNGEAATIIKKIGEGGQGSVYLVDIRGSEYALKWYHANSLNSPRKFYKNLENNIELGAPTQSFLWPKFLTEITNGEFGYVMDLKPDGYKSFSDFLLT
ncbi:MAG: protein kinase, partial [Lachnospiraceae bacterium]|nr:protein kinase [Lachnospiraceae bacterium]